jgi:hypothetical protein
MSYLSELLHRQITVGQALAKSVGYIKRKTLGTVSDADVDAAVAKAEKDAATLAATLQKQLATYIAAHIPLLPADVIAAAATTAALNAVDVGIAGLGNIVKANN